MGLIDRIKARRAKGRGFLAWLLDRGGWRTLAKDGLELGADIRRARRGADDRIADGMDVAGHVIDTTPGDGTE